MCRGVRKLILYFCGLFLFRSRIATAHLHLCMNAFIGIILDFGIQLYIV